MDRTLTNGEITVLQQFPHSLKKFICWRPIEEVGRFVVDGDVLTNDANKSVYGFAYRDDTGDLSLALENYMVQIGTAEGGSDVGVFRLRKLVDTDDQIIYINETAISEAPIEDGMYGRIIKDHRIWERKIRRELVGDIDFIEYYDFDVEYGGENDEFYPLIANVTRDAAGHPYKAMGLCDPGQDYRTIDLCSLLSHDPKLGVIPNVYWNILGISIVSFVSGYGATSKTTRIRMEPGFCELELTVSDPINPGRIGYRYFPLWTFTGPDDPNLITNFTITKDSRGEGRDMSFFVGSQQAQLVPEGAMIGYFEIAEFPGGEAPDQYIDQFMGWVIEDKTSTQLYRPRWELNVGGHQTWLNMISIGAQTIYDPRTPEEPSAVAERYIEMANSTPDKMIHYFLRINTTAMEVMNVYFSDYKPPIEGYTSNNDSIWNTIVDISERYCGFSACDSVGSLFLNRHMDFWDDDEIDAVSPILEINKTFWTDKEAPEFTHQKTDKVGLIDIYGSNYSVVFSPSYVDSSHVYHALAPGIIRGRGTGTETPAMRFLEVGEGAEEQLSRLASRYLARKNNPFPDIPIILKGNYDIVEPAWGLPIAITYTDENSRNLELNQALFLVKSVSVVHSNDPKGPAKKITWNVEQVTGGTLGVSLGGGTLPTEQKPDVEDYPDPSPYPEPNGAFPQKWTSLDYGSATFSRASSWNPTTGEIDWENISTGLDGDYGIHYSADPANYGRYFVLTAGASGGLFRCNDIWAASPSWTLVASNATMFGDSSALGRRVVMSINRIGFIAITTGPYGVVSSLDYGSTWRRRTIYGGDFDVDVAYGTDFNPTYVDLAMSPYNNGDEGWGYAIAGFYGNAVFKTEDWCDSFALTSAAPDFGQRGQINVPYMRADEVTHNTNDAAQEVIIIGGAPHSGNIGFVMQSQNAGESFDTKWVQNAGGINVPAGVDFGRSLDTWTYSGAEVIGGLIRTGAGGNNSGAFMLNFLTDISDPGDPLPVNYNMGGDNFSAHVSGFPTSRNYMISWIHSDPVIQYTLDRGETVGTLSFPEFFAGTVGAAEVQWDLSDFVEPIN